MKDKPFITLENVTLRVRDRCILENTSWEMKKDQHWAVLGPNGADKSVLVKSLFGEVPVVAGKMTCYFPGDQGKPSFPGAEFVGYVAPELARGIIARENLKDEFRHFSGRIHRATNVADVITANHQAVLDEDVLKQRLFGAAKDADVAALLDLSILTLSTGEMNRIMIARALMKRPNLLISDFFPTASGR
jgi:ABC-type molybdenum transport system ATPase subunit/photorepair protein PhrA